MSPTVLVSFAIILVTSCLADPVCNRKDEVLKSCSGECTLRVCPKHENYDTRCTASGSCAPSVCDCRFNYKRTENGTCVPALDCPKFNCDQPNEEYLSCPPMCPRDVCQQATPDGRCPALGFILFVVECEPTCRCIKGYWRKNGVCVPYRECPQFSNKK